MKILTKLALAMTLLITAISARADWVSGHFRSNGTYVAPYYRSSYGSLPRCVPASIPRNSDAVDNPNEIASQSPAPSYGARVGAPAPSNSARASRHLVNRGCAEGEESRTPARPVP